MRITTKSRAAVTALIDLALHSKEGGVVSLAEIAERRDISLSYLEQLFASLRKAEVVNSFRGPGGGYVLARDANQISLKDIVIAIDYSNTKTNEANELWSSLETFMLEHMDSINLGMLVQQNQDKLNPSAIKQKKEKTSTKVAAAIQKKAIAAKREAVQKKKFIANSVFSWALCSSNKAKIS
jgi:Rrf2 family iron-sulfur cluster assembly transcriptional regulator